VFIPQIGKIETKRSLFIPQIRKIEAARTRLSSEIGKIEAKKTNWIEVKRTEAVVFLILLWSPGIDSKESIPPAYALAGLYVQQTYSSSVPSPLRLFLSSLNVYKYGLRLHLIAELVPLNRFLGSLNVYKYGLRLHWIAEFCPWNRFLGSLTFTNTGSDYIG
jgi:hypothetical protein